MAFWLIFLSILLCLTVKFLLAGNNKNKKKLPPGPSGLPIIGNFFSVRSFSDLEPLLRRLRPKFGPILTLYIGPRPSIFIIKHSLAHQALIQNGAVFADRPPSPLTTRVFNSNQQSISSAFYGPLWRTLRRNLISETLNPARIKSYSKGREWVLNLLTGKLRKESQMAGAGGAITVIKNFQFAMFCLLLFMCFGEQMEEDVVHEVEASQRALLLNFGRFSVLLNLFPRLGKFIFRKRWMAVFALRRRQEKVLIPLIKSHKELDKETGKKQEQERVFSYVDSLLALDHPEKRKLTDGEIVTLCSEFLNGGTDTTSTSLQWIMANLVKNPKIQDKLVEEIKGVVEEKQGGLINEEDVQKMPYLKAVIMEALRRHPPGHFVLPHAVSEEVSLEGYVIPKNATVNFMVAEMGVDPEVWEEPLEFKPERFLDGGDDGGEMVDITGSREIKMMPFGAGRRICPGLGLALMHLEYFVANLVWEFEWKGKDGEEVDLSEKQEFTTVMKYPLQVVLVPRKH